MSLKNWGKSMLNAKKIAGIIVAVLVFVGVAVGGVLAIVNNKNSGGLDEINRTERLSAPNDLAISDDWVLRWDSVSGAISYNVIIDGKSTESTQTNYIDLHKYATVGKHSFTVRAIHSLPVFHSLESKPVYKAKTLKLDTPSDVMISEKVFSWKQVTEAKSYMLLIEATNTPTETVYSTSTEFDLSNYVASHPDVTMFKVKVCATAYDPNKQEINEYITNSDFSECKTYSKASEIVAPTLSANFAENPKTLLSDVRQITWNVDQYINEYVIYLDGSAVRTISKTEIGGQQNFTFTLNDIASRNVLGGHTVYVVGVAVAMEGMDSNKFASNVISYSITQKLSTISADSIKVSMVGTTLNVDWAEIPLASDYSIVLQGREGTTGQFVTFATIDNNVGNRYTRALDNDFAYDFVRAQIQACARAEHEFVTDGDFSEWSEAGSVKTTLESIANLSVNSDEENLTANWVLDGINVGLDDYIDGYSCVIYQATAEGKESAFAFGVTVSGAKSTSVNLTEALKRNNKATGWYAISVVTIPKTNYSKFFNSSEKTESVFFLYKERIDSPTGLKCVRANLNDGTSTIKFSFYGTVGATGYRLTITGEDLDATTLNYSQPNLYQAGQLIEDTTQIQALLGKVTQPKAYNFKLIALAPTGENVQVIDSNAVEYKYIDILKHSAVDVNSIEFVKLDDGNSVEARWTAVPTARAYGIWVNGTSWTANENKLNITNSLTLGKNTFKINCLAMTDEYEASEFVATTYEYTYTITSADDVEISYELISGETNKIKVSIPQFDSRVTDFAIQFGDKTPQNMTVSDGVVYYLANMTDDLPLYLTTNITIYAGASVVDEKLVTQEFITQYKAVTDEITNDFCITAPTITAKGDVLTFEFDSKSLKFTQKVEYKISKAGRTLKSGTITHSELYDDETGESALTDGKLVYSLTKLINGDESTTLDAGEYTIWAKIYAISGAEANSQIDYQFIIDLDDVDVESFRHADDETYLQWNSVFGADGYTIAVTFNGVAVQDVSLNFDEYVDGSTAVIRLNTINLFSKYGLGTYKFSVQATNSDSHITDANAVTHTWVLTLATPTFEVVKYGGTDTTLVNKVVAKILKNSLADKYILTLNGGKAEEILKTSNSDIFQYVALDITQAGKFVVTLKAVRLNDNVVVSESGEAICEYINIVTADKPANVSAKQDLETDTITLTCDSVTATIQNGRNESDVKLSVEASISNLRGEFYSVDGSVAWFELAGDGTTLSTQLSEEVKSWMREQTDSVYRVYFRTKAYSESSIYADGELIVASSETSASLPYQKQLAKPSFKISGGTVVSAKTSVTLKVTNTNLGENAKRIDIGFYQNGSLIRQADAVTVSDGEAKITADMLKNVRGTYEVRIRASNNGTYVASLWSDDSATITCATSVDNVKNIQYSRVYSEAQKSISVAFDPISDENASVIKYSAVLSFEYNGTTYKFNMEGASTTSASRQICTLNYASVTENKGILQAVLGESPQSNLVLTFVITAQPQDATNLCLASETTYVYTIGQVASPQNFIFEKSTGNQVNVKWTGDSTYDSSDYETTYSYTVTIQNADSTSSQTTDGTTKNANATITLPDDYDKQAYLVHFEITGVKVTLNGTEQASFTGSAGDYYIYSLNTTGATLVVDYEDGKYIGKITHQNNNSNLFGGQTYEVSIAGSVVASASSNPQFTIDADDIKRLIVANKGQNAKYTIAISDAVYTIDGKTLVAYKGLTSNGKVTLPLVITSSPTAVTIDETNNQATVTNIPYVTDYEWRIVKKGGSESVLEGTADSINTEADSTNFTVNFSSLSAGEYTIFVKASTNSTKKIYADGASECKLDFVHTVKMDSIAVNTTKISTTGNKTGDFATTLTWNYAQNLAKNRFAINFVSIATGKSVLVDMGKVGENQFTATEKQTLLSTYYAYSLTFAGLDLISGTSLGYDPTRELSAGEYKVTIQVLGVDEEHYSASDVVEFGSTYKNMFGVIKVTASAFVVAPECFFGSNNIKDGEIVFGENEQDKAQYLQAYEQLYDFNRKQLIITEAGAQQNRATSFMVKINGQDFGVISKTNGIASVDFENIKNATQFNISRFVTAGANTISLMPYTNDEMLDYYYYVAENGDYYRLDNLTAQSALTVTFDLELYQKFATPSDPRVELGYSDKANHNINKINVTFGNASSDKKYSVDVMYYDYYETATTKTATKFGTFANLSTDETEANLGIAMYDLISTIGPHEVWFVIRQTASDGADNTDYYLSSNSVETASFVFTTAMPEFASSGGAGTCVVTEITSANMDKNTAYKINGSLMWTLPTNAYDMTAQYSVLLKDTQGKEVTKTVRLKLEIVDGKTVYSLTQNDDNLFMLVTSDGCMYFDMTKFFFDTTTRASESYYLAGEYYYQITATALDKDGNVAKDRIFDPANKNYGNKFIYKDIKFPVAPYDAKINTNGILSWQYDDALGYKYTTQTTQPTFRVVIKTYKASDKSLLNVITLDPTTARQIDLTKYLVAGGEDRNEVSVSRVLKSEYYLDSEPALAEFVGFDKFKQMPEISASWTAKSELDYSITANEDILGKVATELLANDSNAKFTISLLRVSKDTAITLDENANFDTILGSDIDSVSIVLSGIEVDLNNLDSLKFSYDLISAIKSLGKSSEWLSGENFIAGEYFVKVEFSATAHQYFKPSVAYVTHEVKNVWEVVDEAKTSLYGEYLTTKSQDTTTVTVNGQDDRNWANAKHKEAILSFNVYAIRDFNGTLHMPKKVMVSVKLRDGTSYVTDRIYEFTYSLPSLADLLTSSKNYIQSEDGNCWIYRLDGVEDYYNVRIDIHDFFDGLNYAGVYALEYMICEDENGASSDTLYLNSDICHYVALPTPILDYRLGITQVDSGYAFVLNWALTPNQYTHIVDTELAYKINIFAFKQNASGTYSCDNAYASASDKQFFLQNETALRNQTSSYGFVMGNLLRNGEVNSLDGRACYIDENGSFGLDVNGKYKFFIYLTPQSLTENDPNISYYLSSETSIPQEYLYKTISAQHYGTEVHLLNGCDYVTEDEEDFENKQVYEITSLQDTNNYNNGFELFVYNTLDANAGSNNMWTVEQEENGTYLAHYIITTLDNASAKGKKLPLYVVDNSQYTVGKNQPLEYLRNADGTLRQIGELENSSIRIYGFTLSELLNYNANIPVTYYCKIKSWINNNDLNANAFVSADGLLEDVELYGEKWVRTYLTQDNAEVEAYVEALKEQGVVQNIALADFNCLNPSYYFTFKHTVRFKQPSIEKIEIYNNDGASDLYSENGNCVIDYTNSNSGVISGYITANSNGEYTYKFYLNSVSSTNEAICKNKYIRLGVSTFEYSNFANGIIDYTDLSKLSQEQSVILPIQNDGDKSYVILNKYCTATNAVALYNWLDSQLPNKVYFTVTAVMDEATASETTTGELDYSNPSYNFATSEASEQVSLGIRKQYSAPKVTFMFDNAESDQLISADSTQRTSNNTITNVLGSGNYSGMALNPYLYVSGSTYREINAQGSGDANFGFEYVGLTNRQDTNYVVEFTYNGTTVSCEFATKDINTIMREFAKAVNSNATRYDYDKGGDVYPYEVACLYQTLYKLVNGTSSDYHGGVVSAKVKVVAPVDTDSAGYWVSSDYGAETDLAFYVRLETVETSFNASEATLEENSQYFARLYADCGYYYYYQNYIPFRFNTISKTVEYRVVLTRKNENSTGNFVYSYDTVGSVCAQNPSAAGWHIVNLAEILKNDQYGTNLSNSDLNQWLLGSVWNISIYANADETLLESKVTRGFNSFTRTYSPKLKIFNDISAIKINMDVDKTARTVGAFKKSNIAITSQAPTDYNSAVSSAEFTYNLGKGNVTKTFNVKQNEGKTCYPDVIYDFINTVFINSSVIGGKYTYSVRLLNDLENAEASSVRDGFVFEYYKQIGATDITASATQSSQSNSYLTIKASIGNNLTISKMNVALAQRLVENTSTSTLSSRQSMTQSSSGSNYVFNYNWNFNKSYADCFLTGSAGDAIDGKVTQLTTLGCVTSNNKGYIQAGYNTFYIYPVQESIGSGYNLLAPGTYVETKAKFIVPSSYAPTISLSSDSETEGGVLKAGETYTKGTRVYAKTYYTAKYVYVTNLSATFTNADGYLLNANWKYGWKKNSSETTCTKKVFTSSDSTSSISTATSITLAGDSNYANYNVTLYVRSGFEACFRTPKVTKTLSVDLSSKHTERTYAGDKFIGYTSTS